MLLFLSIIAFILIFSVLILIHEFGHYYVAKKAGIKVEEFGFGLPPKIFGFKPKGSETTYTLNAIPFGGFVKLYGEDSSDKKVLASKRSFASKSPRVKMAVAAAGVIMNFLLAFVLLVIGFIFGMQPLFVNQADVFTGINDGVIEVKEGLIVKTVSESNSQILPGDQITSLNGKPIITVQEFTELEDGQQITAGILRNGQVTEHAIVWDKENPAFKTFDAVALPRIVLQSIDPNSIFSAQGLMAGDIILRVDGQGIYSEKDLNALLENKEHVEIEVLRGNEKKLFQIHFAEQPKIILSEVYAGTPAENAGLLQGDLVTHINDQQLNSMEDVRSALKLQNNAQIKYTIQRMGNVTEFFITPDEQGQIGVALAPLFADKFTGFTYYPKAIPTSILKINDIRYPIWQAPGKALEEMGRLSVFTVQMFGNVFSSIITKLAIPEGVSGPVGIAQMTYTFVQEGLVSLLRFTALLSLSLAIINILPFPALDGGRFFMILLSVIIGKKINPKFEAWLHIVGFILLMALITFITFNDILRIFAGA